MLSNKIRELRKQSKISQEKLAEQIGVSRQAVTKWETNRGEPGVDNLIQLATYFGISVDELLDYRNGRSSIAIANSQATTISPRL